MNNKNGCRKGFSLVEMIIVMIILAVLSAFMLMSGSTSTLVDDKTEADKIVRALQSMRSGWIASYSDNQEFLGLRGTSVPASQTFNASAPFTKSLEVYIDRTFDDEIAKYGNIMLITDSTSPGNPRVYLGFALSADKRPKDEVLKILQKDAGEHGLFGYTAPSFSSFLSSNANILLRVY